MIRRHQWVVKWYTAQSIVNFGDAPQTIPKSVKFSTPQPIVEIIAVELGESKKAKMRTTAAAAAAAAEPFYGDNIAAVAVVVVVVTGARFDVRDCRHHHHRPLISRRLFVVWSNAKRIAGPPHQLQQPH
jgi:hypothetical protein